MKNITNHLGAILTTLVAFACIIAVVSMSAPSISGFFGDVVEKDAVKAQELLNTIKTPGLIGEEPEGEDTTPDNTLPDPDPDHAEPTTGDTYETGNYIYYYNARLKNITGSLRQDANMGGWGVAVKDKSCREYEPLHTYIYGKPVVALAYTFAECEEMSTSPEIPSTVTNMNSTYMFSGLRHAPKLPEGIKELNDTFSDCEYLDSAPAIPGSVEEMYNTFKGCNNLMSAPKLPEGLKRMSYTFASCIMLQGDVTIPSTVTSFDQVFDNTESPINMYYYSSCSAAEDYSEPGNVMKIAID